MTEYITRLLVEFQLANTDAVPPGWVVRVLARCGIPYAEIWDVFHQMYESQVRDASDGYKFYRVGFSLFLLTGPPVQFTIGCSNTLGRNLRAFPRLARGGEAHAWRVFPCRSYRFCSGAVPPGVAGRRCPKGYTRGL